MSKKISIMRARHLRKKSTDAEKKLWSSLRLRQCHGFKFRRQVPLGNYIVDFVCLEASLIIEADGGQHNIVNAINYDTHRTMELEKMGFKVLRFWNDEILTQIEVVQESIVQALENHLIRLNKPSNKHLYPPSCPSPASGGRNLLQPKRLLPCHTR